MSFSRSSMIAFGLCLVSTLAPASAFVPMNGIALRQSPLSTTLAQTRHTVRTSRLSSGIKMQTQGQTPPLERAVACLPYALPLADGFEWGRFVFEQFPLVAVPFIPLFPVMELLNAPFVSFGIFIVLFTFVARNPSLSRFVRFNTLQAIYLDIALIFPQLLKGISGATGGLPNAIGIPLTNCVFYAMLAAVGYSVYKNIIGETPNEIPVISESVDSQMPF